MITLTVNGVSYQYPESDDNEWGDDATAWAQSVSQNTLQKSGGSFPLTAEVDFGATYGLKTPYVYSKKYVDCAWQNPLPAAPGSGQSRMFFSNADGKPYFYIGASSTPVPMFSDVPQKTYIMGTVYTNGTPGMVSTLSGWALQAGRLIPYQTVDGQWWIRGHLEGTFGAGPSFGGNQLTFDGFQCMDTNKNLPIYNGWAYLAADGINNRTEINAVFNGSYGAIISTFEFPIVGKPSWAD